MSDRVVIPIVDARSLAAPPVAALGRGESFEPQGSLFDARRRPLRDLRISVTDRCNFRCTYCMPREVFGARHQFLPQSALLSFEEIARLATAFVAHGVQKIRLTGGEPLLRRHLERLVEMLSRLRTPSGEPLDLTLTTNASLLAHKAQSLKDAGLKRVTVSLDALDDTVFRRMNDADYPVSSVLRGIEAAQQAGLGPIKVNMVVQRGVNEGEIVPMARHFRGSGVALRFIEYMGVGQSNGWRMDQVLPSSEVLARLQAVFPLLPVRAQQPGETAQRWRHADGQGEVGFISSVTEAFCGDCNRARLSTEGKLFLCLFAHQGHDLRTLLRPGRSDADLAGGIAALWAARQDRYSEARTAEATPQAAPASATAAPRVEMHYIGG